MVFAEPFCVQRPLIHEVDADDFALASRDDLLWYDLLRNFNGRNWRHFQVVGAKYYEALWLFNDVRLNVPIDAARFGEPVLPQK